MATRVCMARLADGKETKTYRETQGARRERVAASSRHRDVSGTRGSSSPPVCPTDSRSGKSDPRPGVSSGGEYAPGSS